MERCATRSPTEPPRRKAGTPRRYRCITAETNGPGAANQLKRCGTSRSDQTTFNGRESSRPGSSRSIVTEFSACAAESNPTPSEPDQSELTIEDFTLSREMMKRIAGSDDLQDVTSIQMRVDTRRDILDNFGEFLPKLTHLKMNNSLVVSVRDLGTSLSRLQVLWLTCCRLTHLDGVSALPSLKELYVSYNDISELSPLGLLEHLELLDLEGNRVDDLAQVWFLGCCGKLSSLSLEGNPVCFQPGPEAPQKPDYNYRASVRERIPQLRVLDDLPAEEDRAPSAGALLQDWTFLKESLRNLGDYGHDERFASVRLGSAWHLDRRGSLSVVSRSPARPWTPTVSSASSPDLELVSEASDLTNGDLSIICGNPLRAARAQRQKNKLHSTSLGSLTPEDTSDPEDSSRT